MSIIRAIVPNIRPPISCDSPHRLAIQRNALAHNALQNGPKYVAKWPVSERKMARFTTRFDPFCNMVRPTAATDTRGDMPQGTLSAVMGQM